MKINYIPGLENMGFSPKIMDNHISWDSILMVSLVKISESLRVVEHSTDPIICRMLLMH